MRKPPPSTSEADSTAMRGERPPGAVRAAVGALIAALATGIVEMTAQLWPIDLLGDSLVFIAIRLLIYAAVLAAIVLFARGRNWARLILLFGLGVVGMLSLIIDPAIWIFSDSDLGAFIAEMDAQLAVITGSRIAHIAAVIVAVVAMIQRSTRQYCSKAAFMSKRYTHASQEDQ